MVLTALVIFKIESQNECRIIVTFKSAFCLFQKTFRLKPFDKIKFPAFLSAVNQMVFGTMQCKKRIAVFQFILNPLRAENPKRELRETLKYFPIFLIQIIPCVRTIFTDDSHDDSGI